MFRFWRSSLHLKFSSFLPEKVSQLDWRDGQFDANNGRRNEFELSTNWPYSSHGSYPFKFGGCFNDIVDLVNTILFLCISVSLFLMHSLMQTFFQSVLSHWEWSVVSYQTPASKLPLSKMAENLGTHVWVMVPAGFRHLGRPQSILRLILGSRKSLRI